MEVLFMYKSAYREIARAIEDVKNGYQNVRSERSRFRSPDRRWDRILWFVCAGCGKPLGKYETEKKLSYCYECREILFPETIRPIESWRKRKGY